MSKILIVSDAWFPQVNGVVRTMDRVVKELEALGHEIKLITPELFLTIPCPTYPEIRLVIDGARRKIRNMYREFQPDHFHIVVEGPLGWSARNFCIRNKIPFSTSYHTKFPEYVHARWKIPLKWTYSIMRKFHKPSGNVMVATQSIRNELEKWGFTNCCNWTRGVDLELFQTSENGKDFLSDERPISICVGRVAVEKNIEAFLELGIPGTKYVVGDGPAREKLIKKYPNAIFPGVKKGKDLVQYIQASDVLVFPSKTDTFGLVMLEALACGVPVSAYPVPGPNDVIGKDGPGILDDDLETATLKAMEINPDTCREYANKFSWKNCAEIFFNNLVPIK